MTFSKLPLTKQQKRVQTFIYERAAVTGVVPDPEEIEAALQIKRPNISRYIAELVARGWLDRTEGIRNGLRIPGHD